MRKLLPKSRDENPLPPPPVIGKRKRVQCDNRRPTCSQCIRSVSECRFSISEDKTWHDALAHQLQVVSEGESSIKTILDLLHGSLENESTKLLNSIREAQSVNDFVKTFADASLLLPHVPQRSNSQNIPTQLLRIPFPLRIGGLSPGTEPLSITDDLVAKFPDGVLPISQWTTLSTDNRYLSHILYLFFTWDHTLSHIIPRTVFLQDIKAGPMEPAKLCSRFLVNSLIAVSHIFISQGVSSRQGRDLRFRGRMFADEALRVLEDERQRPSITLLQGLTVLWIYEVNYGEKAQAISLLEEFYHFHSALGLSDLAMPAMDDTSPSQVSRPMREWQVLSCIVWGFFCFEAKISLIFSRAMRIRKPEIPKIFEDAYLSVFANPDAPEYFWSPYPYDRQPRQSLYREAISLECQLAVIVEEASRFFTPAEAGTPVSNYNETRVIKEKLQRWGTGALQRFLAHSTLLPSILFLEITYEMIFLKLLGRPCQFPLQDDAHESTASTRASYGASIVSNLWVYRAAYGMRHEYWLTQACLEAVKAIIFKLDDNSGLSKSVVMACQLLYSIGEFLPVANEYLLAIKELARQQTVNLPKACRIIFSGLAVRTGRIIIRGPVLVNVGLGYDDMSAGSSSASSQEVVFSGLIEGIRNLAGRSS
ncbi:hypothetical protein FOQG_15872 [Fusarium oxysporum f. sp. raphani 54005]|uniref:Transcription factor domain-containing protein n=2 Tax=Fusarium oxysporum f. sp. raphani TaxID=96318 RepID=X0BKT8_FUSOX|nr:hypothetical protein FOQG_15872 [Fusarium oxysporum f. sp. raphani 54005]